MSWRFWYSFLCCRIKTLSKTTRFLAHPVDITSELLQFASCTFLPFHFASEDLHVCVLSWGGLIHQRWWLMALERRTRSSKCRFYPRTRWCISGPGVASSWLCCDWFFSSWRHAGFPPLLHLMVCDVIYLHASVCFRPHRMRKVWTIAIDYPGVCQSATRLRCENTAERIEVLFGV